VSDGATGHFGGQRPGKRVREGEPGPFIGWADKVEERKETQSTDLLGLSGPAYGESPVAISWNGPIPAVSMFNWVAP
jgi:hypothetical protein